ncbi:hypothetical protein F5I97DRAFT_1817756 [Phlebopus sp. FC_14]|nr:hypothetical protein F5I97DRAFT_1817756 [Phlebopus sp. FC_14]
MALQPLLKAPSGPTGKPRSVLKPPPMPIPVASANKPLGPLKQLAPPALPQQPMSPQKNMKTIFTTSVALATDPTKEGAGAELLSLFLQQHGHGFISTTDRELQRGMVVSPNKRWKGKDPKFVRGGFAERAQNMMSCARTDFALWKRQTEPKLESNASPKLSSDMRLHIHRIFHVSKVPDRPRAMSVPRNGLALCRVMMTGRHRLGPSDLTEGMYIVLFHFAPPQGTASVVSSTEQFEEGKEVLVWMPWQKLELAGPGSEATDDLRAALGALDELNSLHGLLVVSRFCFCPRKVTC